MLLDFMFSDDVMNDNHVKLGCNEEICFHDEGKVKYE
jgi:hypothetical protein